MKKQLKVKIRKKPKHVGVLSIQTRLFKTAAEAQEWVKNNQCEWLQHVITEYEV